MSSLEPVDFGAQLREWRRKRALSQRDLASLAGIQQATVARLETGAQQPRPRTIRKLAKALDAPIEALQG